MKVKDFIEVYDGAYLVIETKEAVYTDCSAYAAKAHNEGFYDVPIILFRGVIPFNSQLFEKEITGITASEIENNDTIFYLDCDIDSIYE